MRNRATAAAPVVAFAVAVAAVAVLAARSGDGDRLVRLPAAFGASAGEADAAATTSAVPTARSALMPAFKVDYRVEGTLPDLPATAPAYRLASDASAADVQAVATALGLAGQPVADGEGWVVHDGSRALRVMRAPGLPWYLGEDCPEAPVQADDGGYGAVAKCAMGVAVSGAGASGSGGVATDLPAEAPTLVAPVAPCGTDTGCATPTTSVPCKGDTVDCSPPPAPDPTVVPLPAPDAPARPADMPSRQEAARLAREAFARLGVGDAGFAVEDGWLAWDARVETSVDGVAVVGQGTSVGIGPKGRIVRANGWLARPERIGGYPLVGVQAGLERLRSGFGSRPMAMAGGRLAGDQAVAVAPPPGPEPATTEPGTIEPAPPAEPPVTVEPTPAPPVPGEPQVMTVVVVGARLALLQVGDALVPAYVFELQGGGDTVPVPAVADEWLDQQATTLQKG